METDEDEEYEYDYSDEEDYNFENGSNDDENGDDDDDDDMDWNSSGIVTENPNAAPTMSEKGIRMLPAIELIPEMNRRLKDVTEILDIPTAAATVLLREHNWSKEQLFEVFYADSEKILKKCGVFHRCYPKDNNNKKAISVPSKKRTKKSAAATKKTKMCPICYDEYDETSNNMMMSMPCGHEFCLDCWEDFCINAIVQEGPSCVFVTCPEAGCTEVVTEIEVEKATKGNNNDDNNDHLQKFQTYQLRNFVDSNTLTRWCPGIGCESIACAPNASAMESEGNVAKCDGCCTSFCVICGEEPHSPIGCKDLELWNEKCRNESETANWILANTKSCPKCSSRIEKNQGCNHITCQRCKHDFCWICGEDWSTHGASTGGYYKCNKYDPNKGDGNDQSASARAKRELDRYLHYYKRFHAHSEAQKFAKKSLKETENRMVLLQESSTDAKWSDVEFLKTANEQLVECRRVLKYTYVYAYYLNPTSSSDADSGSKMQKERFEYHQEMLEKFTENLSELSEKPVQQMDRTDVVNQTRVVDRFMKNILKYVEEGMDN